MNKYILLLVLTIFSSTVDAQNFTVTPNPAYGEADLDDPMTDPDDIVAQAQIFNNTNDTLFFNWERIVNDKPDGWETSVFGVDIHLLPNVSSSNFILYPNDFGEINVHAYPGMEPGGIPQYGAIPGEATVQLKLTNLYDLADTLTAVFLLTLSGSPVLSLSELELERIKVFPNPATDYFILINSKEIDQLVVYDILGQEVKTFDVNGKSQFEINDLPNGSYLIGLFDKNQQNIKIVRFQKQ